MDRELMDTEKLITETFTAHEHVVPDADTVLAAARRRIHRRRAVSRPLAVAAGVAALSLAAVTVVTLNRPGPTPADGAAASASESQVTAVADLTMPYSLDWLPPGEVDYLVRRVNMGATAEDPDTPLYGGEYMLTVTGGGQVLYVDVQQFRMVPVDQAEFKSGAGSPVTINGQPGVESSGSDGYELYVAHPDGGSMYVDVSPQHGSTATTQQLVDVGRQIAQNIRFPGTATVTPLFGLGALPNGMRICAFGVQESFEGAAPNTSYSLGTCTTAPPIHVNIAAADDPTGTAGRPVQGHPTRYVEEDGYHKLWVLDAVDGAPVAVAGRVPLTDLYDVANRLVLPS